MSHTLYLPPYVLKCKMKRTLRLLELEVIMVVNLKIKILKVYLMRMEFPLISLVLERKNRTLQEMARTMIQETNIAKYFWAEAVNTACYIQNRISIRPILNKTPYELWKN